MGVQLQPREQFAIVRQLPDHTDETTYYVQAVIRNSVTGVLIDTVRLTDEGSRRFSKIWEVPADVSREGFFIDILTSVYSDSGYTTKAAAYGDDLEQYLVFDRMPKGGGGGMDVDYKKIEKILKETIKPLTGLKNADLAPVLAQIKGVMSKVEGIKIPEMEKMDHTPVLKAIGEVEKSIVKSIDNKEVTEKTDMGEVMQKLEALMKKEPNLEQGVGAFEGIRKILTDYITDYNGREGAKEKLAQIKEALGPVFRGEDFKPTPVVKEDRAKKLFGSGE